jgi:hypothetical protein
MSLLPIAINPGIYSEASPRTAVGRFKNGSNVRFFKSNPEKLGGWVKYIATSMLGICRSLLSWQTLSFQDILALGTNLKLYLSDSVSFFDITPIAESGTLGTDPFSTTDGSAEVTVTDTGHGRSVGDFVNFTGADTVGGLDMNAGWVIDTVPDDDTYTFIHDSEATATETGGGDAVDYAYEITTGPQDSILGTGWGAGGWGSGTWGTARVSQFLTIARIWSLVNWGEDLVASPVDREIYIWQASGGTDTRATLISEAPSQNRRVILSPQLRILVSCGSHDGTNPDPMLIRWSDSEDYTDWTPSPTNAAGDKRLDNGSQIITALLSRDEIVVITDTTVYSMTLSGDNLIFNFADKGQVASLTGPNAACDVNGVVYAMGRGTFWTYDGSVKILPCDVQSKIFENINIVQAAKCVVGRNKSKNEILIFWPSKNAQEVDKVAGFNYEDGTWWVGDDPWNFTALLDQNVFGDVPMAAKPSGNNSYLCQTEVGHDADVDPLPYFLETYDMEIPASSSVLTGASTGSGEIIERFARFFPDYAYRDGAPVIIGNHKFSVKARKYPVGQQMVKGPKSFNVSTLRLDMHMRARQIALRWEGNELGNDISLGQWRVDGSPAGRR